MSFPVTDAALVVDLMTQVKEFVSREHNEDGTHGNGWQKVKWSNSYFTGAGVDADWSVDQSDMRTYHYRFNPYTREMAVACTVYDSTVANTPGSLKVAIPLGKRAAFEVVTSCWLDDNGTVRAANAAVTMSDPAWITVARDDAGAMTNATNNSGVGFLIIFVCLP